MPNSEYKSLYIGLMSGTSMDAIDAVLVNFSDHACQVIAARADAYPRELRKQLMETAKNPDACTIDKVAQLDRAVAECFRNAVLNLLDQARIDASSVIAIGSHGQTLQHQPKGAGNFSLQIGDPHVIAFGTGITTIADFRRSDIAVGGEGAPLTPAFHQWLLMDKTKPRTVLNIGGIANITILDSSCDKTIGFDTGPGNVLLDGWSSIKRDQPYDSNGAWAREGKVDETLLASMLADPYFSTPPPKSTGIEYFNNDWTGEKLTLLAKRKISDIDVQCTLSELTARSICQAIQKFSAPSKELIICGGGVHNQFLIDRLHSCLPSIEISSTKKFNLHPDWVEATAFAWLAKRCLERKPGNIPTVTGAEREVILGGIFM